MICITSNNDKNIRRKKIKIAKGNKNQNQKTILRKRKKEITYQAPREDTFNSYKL